MDEGLKTPAAWYRFEDVRYAASVDECGDPAGPGDLAIETRTYPVLRETPKGVWLDVWGRPRFVLRSATKRFACPTLEEAAESFRARKTVQARIYRARLARAEEALRNFNRGQHHGRSRSAS